MAQWDFSMLLDPSKGFEEHLGDLREAAGRFERWRAKLDGISSEEFSSLLAEYRSLVGLLHRITSYAEMRADVDASSALCRAQLALAREAAADASNRIRFFTHWWKDADDATVSGLEPVLGPDRYVFTHMRSLRRHSLPEEQERIITLKNTTGSAALNALHDLITSRMLFPLDGRMVTDEEVRSLFSSADRARRRMAYDAFHEVRARERDVLAEIYRNIVLDWEHGRELRGYDSAIGIRNKGNDLPDGVVAVHLAICRASAPLWQRFFRIKERLLGHPLTRYDLYAPLPEGERTYAYGEAVALTLDAFGRFSPGLRAAAEEIYSGGYVDAFPRQHKRSGAYCASITPALPPFLLYNFTGKLSDVRTIAHETGHAVHAQLGRGHTVLSWGHSLPIAETASVFGELLLSDLLAAQADPGTRRALLVQKLNELYGTIARQSFFTIFEIRAHELIAKGATVDQISDAYMALLREQLGDMEIPAQFAEEWLAIPHFFHAPFYCYAYSFGNLLALALHEQYRKEGDAFVPKYEAFLAAAETMSPMDLCAMVGADVTQESFWRGGLAVVERMIDELERLG